ncbi:hypothetical protein PENTCL1PPCAC_30090, partial [Pristionchus entomophagus]
KISPPAPSRLLCTHWPTRIVSNEVWVVSAELIESTEVEGVRIQEGLVLPLEIVQRLISQQPLIHTRCDSCCRERVRIEFIKDEILGVGSQWLEKVDEIGQWLVRGDVHDILTKTFRVVIDEEGDV